MKKYFLHFCAQPFHSHWRTPPCSRRLYCCTWDSLDTPEEERNCTQLCCLTDLSEMYFNYFSFSLSEKVGRDERKLPLINKDRRLGSWQDQGWHRRGRRLARGRHWPARPSPCPPTPWWSPPWMDEKLKKMENCCESGFVDNFVMP